MRLTKPLAALAVLLCAVMLAAPMAPAASAALPDPSDGFGMDDLPASIQPDETLAGLMMLVIGSSGGAPSDAEILDVTGGERAYTLADAPSSVENGDVLRLKGDADLHDADIALSEGAVLVLDGSFSIAGTCRISVDSESYIVAGGIAALPSPGFTVESDGTVGGTLTASDGAVSMSLAAGNGTEITFNDALTYTGSGKEFARIEAKMKIDSSEIEDLNPDDAGEILQTVMELIMSSELVLQAEMDLGGATIEGTSLAMDSLGFKLDAYVNSIEDEPLKLDFECNAVDSDGGSRIDITGNGHYEIKKGDFLPTIDGAMALDGSASIESDGFSMTLRGLEAKDALKTDDKGWRYSDEFSFSLSELSLTSRTGGVTTEIAVEDASAEGSGSLDLGPLMKLFLGELEFSDLDGTFIKGDADFSVKKAEMRTSNGDGTEGTELSLSGFKADGSILLKADGGDIAFRADGGVSLDRAKMSDISSSARAAFSAEGVSVEGGISADIGISMEEETVEIAVELADTGIEADSVIFESASGDDEPRGYGSEETTVEAAGLSVSLDGSVRTTIGGALDGYGGAPDWTEGLDLDADALLAVGIDRLRYADVTKSGDSEESAEIDTSIEASLDDVSASASVETAPEPALRIVIEANASLSATGRVSASAELKGIRMDIEVGDIEGLLKAAEEEDFGAALALIGGESELLTADSAKGAFQGGAEFSAEFSAESLTVGFEDAATVAAGADAFDATIRSDSAMFSEVAVSGRDVKAAFATSGDGDPTVTGESLDVSYTYANGMTKAGLGASDFKAVLSDGGGDLTLDGGTLTLDGFNLFESITVGETATVELSGKVTIDEMTVLGRMRGSAVLDPDGARFVYGDDCDVRTAGWSASNYGYVATATCSGGDVDVKLTPADGYVVIDQYVEKAGGLRYTVGADGSATLEELKGKIVATASAKTYKLVIDDPTKGGTAEVKCGQRTSLEKPEKEGYTFDGWFDGTDIYDKYYIMPARDATLTALWHIRSTVTEKNGDMIAGGEDATCVTISGKDMEGARGMEEGRSLVVETSASTVSFDRDAVDGFGEGGFKLTSTSSAEWHADPECQPDVPVYMVLSISLSIGGGSVHELDGVCTVTATYVLAEGQSIDGLGVMCIDEFGRTAPQDAVVSAGDADGTATITFQTGHFSDWIVTDVQSGGGDGGSGLDDGSLVYVIVGIIAVAAVAIVAIILVRKKRQ